MTTPSPPPSRGMACLDQGLDWQDLCRKPLTLLHTKYISCELHGFREEDFLRFSHNKKMGANDPQGVANLDPRSMVGRIDVGDHYTSLHT